eukprot:scaffold142775_cov139-Phaeocystis_antarctica.AAC.1
MRAIYEPYTSHIRANTTYYGPLPHTTTLRGAAEPLRATTSQYEPLPHTGRACHLPAAQKRRI